MSHGETSALAGAQGTKTMADGMKTIADANVATLVPTKSDAERAEEFKRRVIEAYQPLLAVFDEAHAAGFEIVSNSGLGPIGKHMVLHLRVAKVY
jgi:hypothetical protein